MQGKHHRPKGASASVLQHVAHLGALLHLLPDLLLDGGGVHRRLLAQHPHEVADLYLRKVQEGARLRFIKRNFAPASML